MSKKIVFLGFLPRHKSGFPKVLFGLGIVIILSGLSALMIAGIITFIEMFFYGFSLEASQVAEILAEISTLTVLAGICLVVLSYIVAGSKKSPTT